MKATPCSLPAGAGGLATLVDRRSRLTIAVKVRSKHADHVHQKIKQRMKELDGRHRHSITFDNGAEFAHCHRLEKHLGIKLSFADPLLSGSARHERKHPWFNRVRSANRSFFLPA